MVRPSSSSSSLVFWIYYCSFNESFFSAQYCGFVLFLVPWPPVPLTYHVRHCSGNWSWSKSQEFFFFLYFYFLLKDLGVHLVLTILFFLCTSEFAITSSVDLKIINCSNNFSCQLMNHFIPVVKFGSNSCLWTLSFFFFSLLMHNFTVIVPKGSLSKKN